MADNPRDPRPADSGPGAKAGVLSNVANILGVSGAAEGLERPVDVEELKRLGVQPDTHPFIYYWSFLAATAISVVVAVIFVTQVVKSAGIQEVYGKELAVVDPRLAEVRAHDKSLVDSYDVVDAAKGLYRIPVSEAVKLIVENPGLVVNVRSGAAPSTPADAAAPSPTTPVPNE